MIKTRRLIFINNSLPNNAHILLSTGHFKCIKNLKPSDILIDKDGRKTNIREIRYRGKKQMVSIVNEAWHTSSNISEDQLYITSNHEYLLLPEPTQIDWDISKEISIYKKIYTYEFGFIIGFLSMAGMLSEKHKNIVFLLKTSCSINIVKEINRCLAATLTIKDIVFLEGKYLFKYIIDIKGIPRCLKQLLNENTIPDMLLNPCAKDYIRGIANGIKSALLYTEHIDVEKKELPIVYMLNNWLNIVNSLDSNQSKSAKYFKENLNEDDRVWDIILENGNSFIANNMICVSSSPSQKNT